MANIRDRRIAGALIAADANAETAWQRWQAARKALRQAARANQRAEAKLRAAEVHLACAPTAKADKAATAHDRAVANLRTSEANLEAALSAAKTARYEARVSQSAFEDLSEDFEQVTEKGGLPQSLTGRLAAAGITPTVR